MDLFRSPIKNRGTFKLPSMRPISNKNVFSQKEDVQDNTYLDVSIFTSSFKCISVKAVVKFCLKFCVDLIDMCSEGNFEHNMCNN